MADKAANPWSLAAILFAFTGICAPLLQRKVTVFDDVDERLFHLPTIQQFITELPSPDLVDYPSATTPLYHLLLALVGVASGGDLGVLRWVNLAISVLAVWAAIWAMGRSQRAALMVLPLALSPYFVGPAIRLSTDNAALLGVFVAIGLMVREESSPTRAGVVTAATVLTRQIHAWLIGLLLIKAARERDRQHFVALLIPCLLLTGIIGAWGALTPPGFARGHSSGLNPDTAVFAISMFGLYGPFALGWLGPTAWTHRRRVAAAGIAAAIGLGLTSMPWMDDPNRWGGAVWQLAARTPEVLSVPLSFWVLVPIGAAVLATVASTSSRGAMLVIAVGLWLIANLASSRAYQKYYDPMALFILGMAVQQVKGHPLAWVGPALLSLGLAAVTLVRLYG